VPHQAGEGKGEDRREVTERMDGSLRRVMTFVEGSDSAARWLPLPTSVPTGFHPLEGGSDPTPATASLWVSIVA
jgi:hypothetical protein